LVLRRARSANGRAAPSSSRACRAGAEAEARGANAGVCAARAGRRRCDRRARYARAQRSRSVCSSRAAAAEGVRLRVTMLGGRARQHTGGGRRGGANRASQKTIHGCGDGGMRRRRGGDWRALGTSDARAAAGEHPPCLCAQLLEPCPCGVRLTRTKRPSRPDIWGAGAGKFRCTLACDARARRRGGRGGSSVRSRAAPASPREPAAAMGRRPRRAEPARHWCWGGVGCGCVQCWLGAG
jgi:hypothetical protein